jgi:ureidoacrylate peracid hydrolase
VKLGPTPQNSWDVSPDEVSLIRPVLVPRPVYVPAKPQNIVLDIARTGIVVVDMQNDFCTKGGWFAEKGADLTAPNRIVPALQILLRAFRAASAPVFWVNWGNRADLANLPPSVLHAGKPHGTGSGYGDILPSGSGPVLERGSTGAAIIAELQTDPSDVFIHKTRFDGFIDNDFDSVLRNRSISTLVFAGINTDRCVFSTLTHASVLGYDCILVEDACATSSPAYCADTIHLLVRQLYGFTVMANDVIAGLKQSSDPHQAGSLNGTKTLNAGFAAGAPI